MSRNGTRLVCCVCLAGVGFGCGTDTSGSASGSASSQSANPAGETLQLETNLNPAGSDSSSKATASVSLTARPSDPAQTAFANLVEAYRTGQAEQWTRAESAIHAHGSAALSVLLEGLISPDRQIRELASMMLAQVVPALLYAEDLSQRPDTESLAKKLRQALGDDSVEVRVNVAVALSLMEGEGPKLVPLFQELLDSEHPHVRTMAVMALGGLGTPAAPALSAIERMSQTDSDPAAKTAAREALEQMRSFQ